MAGPRSPVSPILDLPFDSSTDGVRGVEGGEGSERLCAEFVAGADQKRAGCAAGMYDTTQANDMAVVLRFADPISGPRGEAKSDLTCNQKSNREHRRRSREGVAFHKLRHMSSCYIERSIAVVHNYDHPILRAMDEGATKM